MTAAIFGVASVMAYALIAGIAMGSAAGYDDVDRPTAAIAGLLWPITLPMMSGFAIVSWFRDRSTRNPPASIPAACIHKDRSSP